MASKSILNLHLYFVNVNINSCQTLKFSKMHVYSVQVNDCILCFIKLISDCKCC